MPIELKVTGEETNLGRVLIFQLVPNLKLTYKTQFKATHTHTLISGTQLGE